MQRSEASAVRADEHIRYSRQTTLPGFGVESQKSLFTSRVLVIGAGGLGSAVIPALAALGVGIIGVVDDDTVELSNLHRQLIHEQADVGTLKVRSAEARVAAIDPVTEFVGYPHRLTAENALGILAGYDLVIDGSDNFPTRYLANDAAALLHIPVVWGAVAQYAGQVGVAWADRGPQYRDLFPTPPAPGSVLSCEAGGVLPSVVATIGGIMVSEAIKILTGIGVPLLGRVTTYDALGGGFRELSYGSDPTADPITALIDYDLFCGIGPDALAESISVEQLSLLDPATFTLLDVREPWESEIASLPGSVLIPLGSLATEQARLDSSQLIVVYCHAGIRSATAVELLKTSGIENATSLSGGIDAWSRRIDPEVPRY